MNLEMFWNCEKLEKNKEKIKKIFFYRICGMGMGTCATLLKESGFDVSGADLAFYPPMGTYLKNQGVNCCPLSEVNTSMLQQYDLIVVGNSVSKGSRDAELIEGSGIPFTSFPCILGEYVLKDRCVIGIAGTHGKTTTTYYLTQLLSELGEEPGHFVGGVLPDRQPSALGKGKYFVIESDEYDSSYFQKFAKLRQYKIKRLVLTSLEFDHADIYRNVEEIEKQFEDTLDSLEQFIGNYDYPSVQNVAKKFRQSQSTHKNNIQSYGFESDFGPKNLKYSDGKCCFEIRWNDKIEIIETNVIGDQNILNLSAGILFCLSNGHSLEKIKKACQNIKNVKRRQEYRGKYKNSIVIDDFAHHPTSVTLTIDSIKKAYPGRKINVFIEPVTSTARSTAFQQSFVESVNGADYVVVADPKIPTNALDFENLNYQQLSDDINKSGVKSSLVENLEQILAIIEDKSAEESVLLFLGNRTILGLWESEFVNKII
ncbi:MAG: hypothetical protein H6621_12785 [Halobacteriovoraceae bacterium]|nr:hypothetical protein [Halobacteriovoraceae bacterium]MCB9095937.1 hypothetical protein [Halobacteriovoraceae bacterium]